MASTARPDRGTSHEQEQPTYMTKKFLNDVEASEEDDKLNPTTQGNASIHLHSTSIAQRLLKFGVEEVGVHPIAAKDRTDASFIKVFTLWVAVSVGVIPLSGGIVGTLTYGLSLRDASLTILFFGLLTALPVAFLSTLGPKTGLRQMVQARYSFGLVGATLPVILNLATLGGYCVINALLGSQTLAAVSGKNLSAAAGVVVVSVIALAVSFMGYRILHIYETWSWIPALICLVIAVGVGGKNFHLQQETLPATAPTILSFGALIAGFIVPYAGIASDFFIYMRPDAPAKRIFMYTYAGLLVPTIPLMVVGAAMGATTPVLEAWTIADEQNHVGGILVAMLEPVGGFGKFVAVLLALSVVGNIAATFYSISLNFQVLFPPFARLPRYLFALLTTAIVIPLSIVAKDHFYDALINFLGIIGYWSSAYCAIVLAEHFVFRKSNPDNYEHSHWNKLRLLPWGVAAVSAGLCSVAVIVPSMYQIWYEGPIAKRTGDIGFELAFVVAGLLYLPFRALEIKLTGR